LFDLDLLLHSFPSYRYFVFPAFGERQSYSAVSTTNFALKSTSIRWMIVHSKGDSLVDFQQAEAIFNRLSTIYTEAGRPEYVFKDWSTFDSEHDQILATEEFPSLVADFIAKICIDSK